MISRSSVSNRLFTNYILSLADYIFLKQCPIGVFSSASIAVTGTPNPS